MRFENQTAVVAACGSEAGAACALNYLQQGAKVALYYDEEARLWPFDQISEEERSRLLTIQISDFRDHEELKRAADQVKEKFGTCDIVVTAVTTVPSKPAYDMDEEEYDRVMKTITNGSLYTIQPLMPMMIEKSGTIRLRDIPTAAGLSPKDQELAAGMVRVTHLYRSALKVAVTQMEILDEEFARLYDHSPIHHIEYRIKTLDSIIDKLRRRGLEVSIDNIYAHIQDVAGIRVICNYLDDIYYLRSLLTRSESYTVLREVDYIKEPKDTGYRSLHLIVNVPIVISEGTMVLPVEIQLRTIAMDMWASLEHELRYKSDRKFTQQDAARLRLCSDAISEIDREMQDIYQGNEPQYHA